MGTNTGEYAIRTAEIDDLAAIEMVDDACFGPEDAHAVRASEGELQQGVEARTMLTVDDGAKVIGYLQYDLSEDGSVYLAGLAVLPSNQGAGLGRRLVDELFERLEVTKTSDRVIITSVAPSNLPMLRLMFSRGFVVVTYVPDYFGEGSDRLILRHRLRPELKQPDDLLLLPIGNNRELHRRLEHDEWVIVALRPLAHGPAFELHRYALDDRATVMANESTVSVAFASVIIGALAFLTGFGFVRETFPVDLLSQLILGLIVGTISLVVYANSTGELSAFHYERFREYMEIGNILSEFGGVYVILNVVPVAVVAITKQQVPGLVTCLASSIAILLYQLSPFDILDRYNNRRVLFGVLTAYLVLSPTAGFVSNYVFGTTSWWSIFNVLMLTVTAWLCLRRAGEVDPENRPDRAPERGRTRRSRRQQHGRAD